MKLKTCSRCKESKMLKFFPRNSSKPDGYHNYCKPCKQKSDTYYREKKQRDIKFAELAVHKRIELHKLAIGI